MSWDREHGCEGPGSNGSAEHRGEPLTVAQIKALAPGARIVVTWSGGNGPWSGTIVHDDYLGVAVETQGAVPNALLPWPDSQQVPINRVTLEPADA